MHICALEPVIIRKAKTRRKVTRTYTRVSALSKQMGRAVAVNLVSGIKTFRRNIPADRLFNAWKAGDYKSIIQHIPWETLPEHLKGFRELTGKTAAQSGEFSIHALPAPVRRGLRFDTKNPALSRYLDTRAGNLIVDIQSDTLQTVRNAVRRSFDVAATPRDVAASIRSSIGLLPRQETAVTNFRRSLEKELTPPDRVDELSEAYADRLLTQRAMTIGRTETRFAANRGQLAVWQEAGKQDLINRATARKTWIVDGNPCPICEPMDGVSVPLDASWSLNNGDVVDIPTDAHPNCFCGMELDYGETPEDDE